MDSDNGRTCLHVAASKIRPGIMRALLDESDADVNAVDFDGRTPLILYCKKVYGRKFLFPICGDWLQL